MKGYDWQWGDQDGSEESIGTVYRVEDRGEVYVSYNIIIWYMSISLASWCDHLKKTFHHKPNIIFKLTDFVLFLENCL